MDRVAGRKIMPCSVTRRLRMGPADLSAYERLARRHYRADRVCAAVGVWAVWDDHPLRFDSEAPVAVIVYAMPVANLALRRAALGPVLDGLSRSLRLQWLNAHVRTIRRVVVDPRYRGLGLASRLVRETRTQLGVPIIEALATMGHVHPFFERAGMRAFCAPPTRHVAQMAAALEAVGVGSRWWVDPAAVHRRIGRLDMRERAFLDEQMKRFCAAYGMRRHMSAGPERTAYVLSRLSERPVYYVWTRPGWEEGQSDEGQRPLRRGADESSTLAKGGRIASADGWTGFNHDRVDRPGSVGGASGRCEPHVAAAAKAAGRSHPTHRSV